MTTDFVDLGFYRLDQLVARIDREIKKDLLYVYLGAASRAMVYPIMLAHGFEPWDDRGSSPAAGFPMPLEWRTPGWIHTRNASVIGDLGVRQWHRDGITHDEGNLWIVAWADTTPTEMARPDGDAVNGYPHYRIKEGTEFQPEPGHLVAFRNHSWVHRTPHDAGLYAPRNFIRQWSRQTPQQGPGNPSLSSGA